MSLTVQKIRSDFAGLKPRQDWSFRDVGRKETQAYTHGYHRYPAKFIPQIVKQLIQDFVKRENAVICDPFGGCGTTLVEAKLAGHRGIGVDINPIAKLITQVKVTPINPKLFEKYKEEFLKNYNAGKGKGFKHHPRIDYWFDKKTVTRLDQLYYAISKIKNPQVQRFFLCAFSHNLKGCSRWLMKSIKPTIDQDKEIRDPKESFLQHLESMIRKNKDFYDELSRVGNLRVPVMMYRKDSTQKLPLKSGSVDLIITSPPYVTSYEYADLHQLSLLWFGDDPARFKKWNRFTKDFIDFRKQFIGTSFKDYRKSIYGSDIATDIVLALETKDRSLSADVANYFSDMRKVFTEMHRILKPGGKACVIIGNTELQGVKILNAEVAVEQMSKLGFRKVDFIKREVVNKMITPWRDRKTGKFTGLDNSDKKRVYRFEYVVVMEK